MSAIVVGFGAMIFLAFCIGKYFRIDLRAFSGWIILAIVFLALPLSMYLWGRILVLVGILTKDEARGYPFPKPWEKRNGFWMF